MTRMVYCEKLKEEGPGLAFAPYPGELGQRIFNNICQATWDTWLARQTMLINENRLSPRDAESRAFLATEMEAFLFGDGGTVPEGYVPDDPK
ncbi:MAG: Fe-S cluster biosynthesis and repair protein YggX [Gammaproteobacteria bacterium]|jgi:Fe-S cluster biosynthesis and repair protein YggX